MFRLFSERRKKRSVQRFGDAKEMEEVCVGERVEHDGGDACFRP